MINFKINKTYYNIIDKNYTITVKSIQNNKLTAIVSEQYLFGVYNNYAQNFEISQNKQYQYIRVNNVILYKANIFKD